jgi:hypothetical protein
MCICKINRPSISSLHLKLTAYTQLELDTRYLVSSLSHSSTLELRRIKVINFNTFVQAQLLCPSRCITDLYHPHYSLNDLTSSHTSHQRLLIVCLSPLHPLLLPINRSRSRSGELTGQSQPLPMSCELSPRDTRFPPSSRLYCFSTILVRYAM